mgnify:CR=1 FL=1
MLVLSSPSGAGKTTLLSLLGGLDRPTAGSVRFGGRELAACSDVELARLRRRMGFVFQGLSLVSGLPAWENVTYPLVPRGVSSRERLRLAADVLPRLDLADKVQTPPEELSGGEQQRVAVARALVGTPEVIFADEPTSNLDRASAGELAGLLSEIHAEGTTLVIKHGPTYEVLASNVLDDGFDASPAIVDDEIFLRGSLYLYKIAY